ncbi:MAG TPA: SCP2 sterol-binding domain-containing protein [Nitriliruptorales bacterium]
MDDNTTVAARQFAKMVRDNDDHTIRNFINSDAREFVLTEIFRQMEGQFQPPRVPLPRLVVHWKILDRPGGGYDHFEVGFKGRRITINNPPRWDRPNLTFRVDGVNFLKLVTGNAHPVKMVRDGRLSLQGLYPVALLFDRLFERPDLRSVQPR